MAERKRGGSGAVVGLTGVAGEASQADALPPGPPPPTPGHHLVGQPGVYTSFTTAGVAAIGRERQRQVDAEGWTDAHDDQHGDGSLAIAAACYAMPGPLYEQRAFAGGFVFADPWPWEMSADKRKDASNYPNRIPTEGPERIRMLARAGALIAAEIDRLLREDEDRHDYGFEASDER